MSVWANVVTIQASGPKFNPWNPLLKFPCDLYIQAMTIHPSSSVTVLSEPLLVHPSFFRTFDKHQYLLSWSFAIFGIAHSLWPFYMVIDQLMYVCLYVCTQCYLQPGRTLIAKEIQKKLEGQCSSAPLG